jgi:long-chain fatty acid transport protein
VDSIVAPQFRTSGTTVGALTPQKAKTTITHPWQAEFGAGYSGFAGTTISASIVRLGWSKFNTLPVTFTGAASASSRTLIEDYDDSWSYRIGAEHTVQDVTSLLSGVTFRAGFSYAESPAPDITVTPLLPDMPRKNGSIGVGLPLGLSTRLDASYLYVGTSGRRGRISERVAGTPSESATAAQLNSGAYDLKANVFSVSLTTHF